jgi:hypothetical protein
METQYFSLEVHRSNKLTKIFQLVFGIICAGVAVIWLILNLSTMKMTLGLAITVLFLLGFAYYQIVSGLGQAEKFIEVGGEMIRVKKNSIFPVEEVRADEIENIVIYPINIVFMMKSKKKTILRFGTTYTEIINPAKDAIENFCKRNNLSYEERNEEL